MLLYLYLAHGCVAFFLLFFTVLGLFCRFFWLGCSVLLFMSMLLHHCRFMLWMAMLCFFLLFLIWLCLFSRLFLLGFLASLVEFKVIVLHQCCSMFMLLVAVLIFPLIFNILKSSLLTFLVYFLLISVCLVALLGLVVRSPGNIFARLFLYIYGFLCGCYFSVCCQVFLFVAS